MVNLLWSNPLPQPQFASLSILLQLDIPKQFSTNSHDEHDDHDDSHHGGGGGGGKIIRNISSDEILALTNDNHQHSHLKVATTTVQLANDNGTKEVPLYPKGLVVNYLKRQQSQRDDHDDDDTAEAAVTTTTTAAVVAMMPATILDVHYDDNLEPYYTIRIHASGVEKQTDNAHIGLIAQQPQNQRQNQQRDKKNESSSSSSEADKSAGPPTTNTNTNVLRHAVLKETITVITPHTTLSENLHLEYMEELHVSLMEGYGLQDDFLGVGKTNKNHHETKKKKKKGQIGDGVSDDGMDTSSDNEENDDEDEDNSTSTPIMMRNNSKVRFGDGTKEGAAPPPASSSSIVVGNKTNGGGGLSHYFGNLPVKIYKPNNCLLGMTLYYLAVYVEDISKVMMVVEGEENNNDGDDDNDDPVKALFRHCASVLVPGISLPPPQQQQRGGGVIVLTVGSTGPPYDIFGASTVIATLPQRLREGMKQLALVNTAPPKERLLTNTELLRQQQQEQQQQQPEKDGSRRFPFLGKSSTSNRSSSQQQQKLLQQLSQSATTTTTTTYDSAYFHRLYMALLATILDDEDGYMREHDEVVMESYPFSPASTAGGVGTPRTSATPSMVGLLADQSMTSSGTVKKNRFTFSRRKVKNDQEYVFGNNGEGMSDFKDDKEGGGTQSTATTTNAGDIVRRMAQKLEVLSIADEDMPIPRYSHLIHGENTNEKSSSGSTPRTTTTKKSPLRKPKPGGGAASSSGRFGRPAVPSDLSGFEYRPSAQQRMVGGGGGGMSVSGYTTSTTELSEDASIMTGDHTAYTAGSQSSVPTLSRSKRDDSSTSSSSSRSRRFMFMKKKKEKSPQRKKTKKPLLSAIPQDQPVYDPFGNDDDDEEKVNANGSSIPEKNVFQTPNNSKSVPVDLDDTPPESPQKAIRRVDLDDTPPESPQKAIRRVDLHDTPPESPQKAFRNEVKQSYSYESEGKESNASTRESNASTAPESFAEPEPEPEPEPTRHLDVSLALNEDLTCEYKQSKLSTLTVEGTIQVRMSTSYEGEPPQDAPSSIPFVLLFKDHSGHVRTLQENKKFVENVSHESEVANREFTYTITIPREEEYFPVVRYKCDTSLRPVPIRVQSRVRTQGKLCRVALQISSNPQNPGDLVHLTVIMGVPPGLKGDTLKCNPPGGVWNESKRVVLWCVSELGGGEKFQLQAIFEMSEDLLQSGIDPAERLEFPVMARCQCTGAQLSDVALDVSDVDMFPAVVSKNVIRRFRVSHKEKK